MKMFEVGGCVRDEILGKNSNDIDFSVVLDPEDIPDPNLLAIPVDPFDIMVTKLQAMGFIIFLETPEHLTVRARFPKVNSIRGQALDKRVGLTADFVLARKEGTYTDGRRPDTVEPGTLMDDLARRDFTMNAIAKDSEGNFIDPFNGREDIARGLIRAVGDPMARLQEDALRAVRALRFSVTKGMRISDRKGEHEFSLKGAMEGASVLSSIANNISDERIQAELSKMFRFNTLASLRALSEFPALTRAMFDGRVSLDATLKTKGRGK